MKGNSYPNPKWLPFAWFPFFIVVTKFVMVGAQDGLRVINSRSSNWRLKTYLWLIGLAALNLSRLISISITKCEYQSYILCLPKVPLSILFLVWNHLSWRISLALYRNCIFGLLIGFSFCIPTFLPLQEQLCPRSKVKLNTKLHSFTWLYLYLNVNYLVNKSTTQLRSHCLCIVCGSLMAFWNNQKQ